MINRVTGEIVFESWHPVAGTSLHDEHVIAVARRRICVLYSRSEVSLMEKRALDFLRGHPLKI